MGTTRDFVVNVYQVLSAELQEFDHSSDGKGSELLWGHYECPFEWGVSYPEHIESVARGMKSLISALGVFDQIPSPAEDDALSVTLDAVRQRIEALDPRHLARLQGDNAQAVQFSHAHHAADTVTKKHRVSAEKEQAQQSATAMMRLPSINHSWEQ